MEPITLKPLMTRRLVKLAKEAHRPPEAMLPFVLRDGFDYCEKVVRAVNAGLADVVAGRVMPHQQAMAEIKHRLDAHIRVVERRSHQGFRDGDGV